MKLWGIEGVVLGVSTIAALAVVTGCGGSTSSGVGGESHFQCQRDADCEPHGDGLVCSPSRGRCVTEAELSAELGRDAGGPPMRPNADAGTSAPVTGSEDSAGTACVPGQAVACACPSGESGTEVCAADGTDFGPCECSGGSSGEGGWHASTVTECEGLCCPTDPACYVEGNGGIGAECLAQRDNSRDSTDRIQLRQTWARGTAPAGNTVDIVYQMRSNGSALMWPECNQAYGTSGFIQLLDFDLSEPDVAAHSLRVGYAPWVPEDEVPTAVMDGLCMVEGVYDDPEWRLPADQMSPTAGWPSGLRAPTPLPWSVAPQVAKRLEEDFELETDREFLLQLIAAELNESGVFYLDEKQGTWHAYFPVFYEVTYVSPDNLLVVPIREAELRGRFNSPEERSCIGAFRAGEINESTCTSADQENPPWGCADDVDCSAGEAPATSSGYVLLTEIEQVFSAVLQSTLCVSYPTQPVAEEDGFAGAWGNNCRGSDEWNPEAGSSGLPTGDWCAATNSPATAHCHDAFRVSSFRAYQGFRVTDATCPLQ